MPVSDQLAALANSAFVTSLVGALAGAFAGAYAAQRVAERQKIRDEIARELRAVNAAIGIAFSLTNSLLVSKKQHVLPMKEHYSHAKNLLLQWQEQLQAGKIPADTPPQVELDLHLFPSPAKPTTTLQDFIFTRIGMTGRAVNLSLTIDDISKNLDQAMVARASLIGDFRENRLPEGATREAIYFGFPYAGNSASTEFGDLVDAIFQYSNHLIFFCGLLCSDLREHGLRLASKHEKLFRDHAPRVSSFNFDEERKSGLYPSDSGYEDWLKMLH